MSSWCSGAGNQADGNGWGEAEAEEACWATQVHGVAPLLFRRLEGTALSHGLPACFRDYLQTQYRLNAERVAILIDELRAVLEAANRAGIEVLPLKGSVLVTHHYEDPGLRPMADLDLLARPDDVKGLVERLEALGYRQTGRTPRHRTFIQSRRGVDVVDDRGEHPANPYCLDLHTEVDESLWGLSYPLTERLWARPSPGSFAGVPGLLVEPVVLLEHLLIHASHDMRAGKFRWIQLHDLRLLAPRLGPEDWSALLVSAAQRAGERFLWAPLMLARRAGVDVAPEGLEERLAERSPRSLQSFLDRSDPWYLSYCNPRAQSLPEKLSWHWPGLEQLRALRSMLLPSPRELTQWYPQARHGLGTPLLYLRYVHRVLGWLWRQALDRRRRAWPYL